MLRRKRQVPAKSGQRLTLDSSNKAISVAMRSMITRVVASGEKGWVCIRPGAKLGLMRRMFVSIVLLGYFVTPSHDLYIAAEQSLGLLNKACYKTRCVNCGNDRVRGRQRRIEFA